MKNDVNKRSSAGAADVTETVEQTALPRPGLIPADLRANTDDVQERREHSVGRLLLRGYRVFNTLAAKRLADRGHEGLGMAHTAILPHIAIEGTRLTTIARLAGMTKQAAAEVLRDLEQQGYIERVVDPADQRAILVKFSVAGQRFLRDAHDVRVDIESEYASLVGESSLAELRRALETIVEHYGDLVRGDGSSSSRVECATARPPPSTLPPSLAPSKPRAARARGRVAAD